MKQYGQIQVQGEIKWFDSLSGRIWRGFLSYFPCDFCLVRSLDINWASNNVRHCARLQEHKKEEEAKKEEEEQEGEKFKFLLLRSLQAKKDIAVFVYINHYTKSININLQIDVGLFNRLIS